MLLELKQMKRCFEDTIPFTVGLNPSDWIISKPIRKYKTDTQKNVKLTLDHFIVDREDLYFQ